MSDEAVIREALETLTADERAWLATMPVWAGGVGGVAIATKYDRLVSRLEAAERERDEAVGNWDAWQDKCFAAEAALAEARAALVIAKSLAIHVSDFAYKEAPAEWDGGDLGYLVGGLASEANDVLDAIGRAALAAAGETAPSEPGVAESLADKSRRNTVEGQSELASRSLHVPGSLGAGVCGASLPFEPGPVCARERGHLGDHVTASGLFRWSGVRGDVK